MNPAKKRDDYSIPGGRSSHAAVDRSVRVMRAEKILAVLGDHCNTAECDALDIGTGSGIIAHCLAGKFKSLTSVDVCDQRVEHDGFAFMQVQNELLPFSDSSFDVVISNQVIEHVWQPGLHLKEIARVLKSRGIGYLATPNRYALIEPHYRLPLLAWLPAPLADCYLRLARGKDWDVNANSFYSLRRLIEPHFEWKDVLPQIATDPVHYRLMRPSWKSSLVSMLPRLCWDSRYNPFLPSFILILTKTEK